MKLFLALTVSCLAAASTAQDLASNTPNAIDMREYTARMDVKLTNMYGRTETRPLLLTIFRPPGEAPKPVLILNHGRGANRNVPRARFEHVSRYFVDKGFVVIAPTRVGYGPEGTDFDPEDNGMLCERKTFGPMKIAASAQVFAALEYAKALPFADTSRWIVAGQSVGGSTTLVTVGRAEALGVRGLIAGINFAGGSGGSPQDRPGRPCDPDALSAVWESAAKTSKAPVLWLYWENDRYWGPDIPKQWHERWRASGGVGAFHRFAPVGEDGHGGLTLNFEAWLPVVDAYLASLGFTASAIVPNPANDTNASDAQALKDTSKLPVQHAAALAGYQAFLNATGKRAVAFGDKGAWAWASGDYAWGKAMGSCRNHGQQCKLYAVNDSIVWK